MKKKLKSRMVSIGLIIAIVTTIFTPITAQANTEEDDSGFFYININSQTDLSLMSVPDPRNYYILTDDIVISGNWNPINNFTGTFDGSGHTITFNIDESTGALPSTQYLGLFGSCTDATIKNLYVNGTISLTTGGSLFNPNAYAGGIVANATNTTLKNVHYSGNINIVTSNDNSSWVGGLVGKATNTQISLCSNTASITAQVNSYIGITKAGGLCGEFSGTIENCYNLGNVLATAATDSPYAGGLVGNNNGSIMKSYNAGTVKSQGSGMSLADVYAGGITALGETGSSVTDCAVMSPEISVVIGWVNTGYKYIIAKGGSKSNNIAINSITGSPSNDANSRYTNAQLKTSEPYSFDFYNTWAIDGVINNGYPYHYTNPYATNIQYQNVPSALQSFIDDGFISINDIKQTDDGFTLCTKPLNEIFLNMGIPVVNGNGEDKITLEDLDCWYIYNIGTSYSILKMRGFESDRETPRAMGTSIPFMDFDISLINSVSEDYSQQVIQSQNEIELYTELDKLIYGKVNQNYTYCVPITNYFATMSSKGNYLIAEEYIRKMLKTERDADGYIEVPDNLGIAQSSFLNTLPDIYDDENNRINVNSYNLTNNEKKAILACRTGNVSLNAYAAENIAHANATKVLGDFLQGTEITLVIEIENEETLEVEQVTIQREIAKDWFESAIKADSGIGEESIPKEYFVSGALYPFLASNFGDV